jgi:2-polyprenyl-3-methyl-5-hydroxy-6-metoxy-1,4-benzoquinol methylase
MDNPKFKLQDNQYSFPYHYLAYIEKDTPRLSRNLQWGFEYLSYMLTIIEFLREKKYRNILDVGCGDGYLLNMIQDDSEKKGIDLSERAINLARGLSHGAEFKLQDVASVEDTYDVVTLVEVLEHIPDSEVEDFMVDTLKCVREGGYFVISVPTTVVPISEKHYRHYDEELLSKHVESCGSLVLEKEMRVFRKNHTTLFLRRLMNNRLWTINSPSVLKLLWKIHKSKYMYGTVRDGSHIVRIYKKLS